ncbi:MAG: asparaginase [Candidatus Atribacteria bacterium]|jgi:L-asparaginase II|nr:asparaginase [Candidatus Atribacteria bacterium]
MHEVLIKIYRGNLIENIYRGDIAIVDKKGKSIFSVGDNKKITYWRSAAKPIQVMPVIYSGAADKYKLTAKEIAIMASSHNGEEKHIELIYKILDKIGLDEKALLCGAHPPFHKPTAKYLYKNKIKISPIYNPCSGKHVAQLTLCQYYGWRINDYYKLEHPVQQMILDVVVKMTEYPKEKIYLGIDGCGVPVFGLPIKNMSFAYTRIVNWELLFSEYQQAAKRIFLSMIKYPDIVGGTDRFDTDLMRVSEGKLLAKSGADGVFCIGVRNENGMGITIKMESGNMKFLPLVVVQILYQLKILPKEKLNQLKKYCPLWMKNYRNGKVGKFISDFELREV